MFGNDNGSWADSGGGYLVMMLGMLVFWGLIIAAVAMVLRQPDRSDRAAGGMVPAHRTAQQVLGGRLARGDIDETAFHGRSAAPRGQDKL